MNFDKVETQGLKIENISKTFEINGDEVEALEDINLDVKEGEFISIVGASGCGKSTLLKLIMGLEKSTSGKIKVGERFC
ncbi:ATP-binding cassette domain-containing protein [Ruminiclostridium josui]|uniref:ATP-binding cassette domain-containing protein n=1 Tax=Ruminiclostridium josui TaxID=1499 RepID=UPI0030ED9719